jgi:hypothetical protein
MIFCESGMKFDFTGMESAARYETIDNISAGLKLVDFIVESKDKLIFIEVKNYAKTSNNPDEQSELIFQRQLDIYRLTSKCPLIPLDIGMKFKDCLFRWLAEGKTFDKEIHLLFIVNLPPELSSRERLRLENRIRNGFIPSGMNSDKYPKMNAVFFYMPPLDMVHLKYPFTVALHNKT